MVRRSLEFFFIGVVGGVTLFVGALCAVLGKDLKKVVAYSTASQLGFVFFSFVWVGGAVSFLYLVLHAFFKALLFVRLGVSISVLHTQTRE